MTTLHTSLTRTRRFALAATLAVLPLGSALAESSASEAAIPELAAPVTAAPVTAVVVPTVQPLPEPAPAPASATRALGSGVASFYGAELHGRRTASGERFDMHALTAAHRTLPFGTRVVVTNPANGRSVTVRINDRGPFHGGRVIDVSRAAASELGLVARGHGTVELALVEG
ncbi:septal ring lytic transglycosylase RlpA family protein [Altererythrobacter sp. H2]|uniref:septal ring lytic transglycosylase RlpA family protein n=1 Tax=Altererythrobacter sp. H2 TaxID=3108391 RepID=UPI002B4BB29E|nr:septal ring lytic transglycosylase RlpA family protein [Altererythrobacter sp. H2]WRK95103.1 septal ring lytic transglycosylase RlpA family protein [Altererythrobacter sp. H2]